MSENQESRARMKMKSMDNRKSLFEIISSFNDGETRYNTDALFRQTIDSIYHGCDTEKVIEHLIEIINSQQECIKKLLQ